MSRSIVGSTSITNKSILLKTLEELGIKAQEIRDNVFEWGSGYQKMNIDLNTSKISYDDMYKSQVEQLEQIYGKHYIVAEIHKKGHRVESIKIVNDEIEITASY
jgi:hypothetical protein